MKLKTRVISMLLCVVLVCGMIPTASAYSGVAQWFEPSLREMQELGLVPQSFTNMNLSKDITRAEMCQLAVHALERIVGWSIEPERLDYFSDTQDIQIVKAHELGIVNGYPDKTFKPDNKLTRQEFFQIVENFCNAAAFLPYADNSYLTSFLDAATVADWAAEAAQICVKYGYVNGKGTQNGVLLDPNGNASRQEAMAMFLRAYKSLNEYYYYIRNAEVVIDNIQTPENVETGNNSVIEDVQITGVDKHMMVTSSGLNVRSLWSKESEILGVVNYGADLTVTGICANGWIQVLYKGQTGYVNGDYVEDYQQVDNTANATAVDIANYAMQFVGCNYVYGGTSPSGFDCSGLVYYCFGQYGIQLKRVADDQMNHNGIAVSRSNLQVGDLVFFGSGSYANHVGIYIGNNNFVHAANPSSGVRVSSMNETYYANRYIGARRILTD